MATTLNFDAAATAQVEAIYATPDVAATRIAVMRAGNPRAGEHILDVGCGPGFLLRDLALATGPTGQAIGVDISEPMLALARRRCEDIPSVRIEHGDATKLPVGDGAIDLACALQTLAYVPNLDEVLIELHRGLKPGGRLVILDTDFDSLVWESRDRERMRRIMTAYDKHVAWPDLPRILPKRLKASGFELQRCEIVPILTLSFNPHTYAYGIVQFIHRFVSEQAGIPQEDADAWRREFDELERTGCFLFSLNRYLFTARRA